MKAILRDKYFYAAFFIGAFILLLTLWFGIGVDAAEYSYCAQVWQHNHLPPYVGCMEKDWPGIFILHRVSLLFGESALGFRIFDALFQLGCLVMIFYLAKRVSGLSIAGFLATTLYALYYYKLWFPMVGEREGFVLFFILLGIMGGLLFEKKVLLRAAFVGLVSGFVFLVRPAYGLVWPVFFIWFLHDGLDRKEGKTWLGLGVFILCCLMPSLLVIFYYFLIGHLRDLYELTVVFVFQVYSKLPQYVGAENTGISMGYGAMPGFLLKEMLRENLPALLGAVAGVPLVWTFGPKQERKILGVLLVMVAVSAISVIVQRGVWEYHRTVLWGFLIIFAGSGYGLALGKVKGQGSLARVSVSGLLCLLLIGLVVLRIPGEVRGFATRYSFRPLKDAYMAQYPLPIEAAEYMKLVMHPEDELYYFGNISMLPFLIGKKLGAPFPFTTHLFQTIPGRGLHPLQEQWKRQYVETFFKLKPRFFIYDDACLQCPEQSFRPVFAKNFPELSAALEKNYHLVKNFDKIEIYDMN
jgi:hypothetical protein